MKIRNALILAAASALFTTGAFASGGEKLTKEDTGEAANPDACVACHGVNGVSTNPAFPHLAGQYRNYLLQALRAYKSGERSNPIMKGQVANLSDQALKDLAKYFASQEGPLYTPSKSK